MFICVKICILQADHSVRSSLLYIRKQKKNLQKHSVFFHLLELLLIECLVLAVFVWDSEPTI